MSENPHATAANFWLEAGRSDMSAAQSGIIESNLAVAYEQRTANLIAIFQSGDVPSSEWGSNVRWGISDEARSRLQQEIMERIGFTEEQHL